MGDLGELCGDAFFFAHYVSDTQSAVGTTPDDVFPCSR
jgi:hypothetical protein